ncbi:hypothetical protein PB2503_08109 [Parvularcula bermudensis HTCC2503]|uniref:Uncharacterized protein n=1 Tax=Parvularcula bermudensis (strain ATCC BAA-594 / HTCC2503 / KCTC 12087) TaxID=314260 RepID=E0THS0_PARBH|nr:phage tail tape measure C-terminal domain-containing protein [Parvularcula bermudensis]ADM09677.1 hypothetical protein PB2503_08109 [Parvularcula bermudensis HTCC2503]
MSETDPRVPGLDDAALSQFGESFQRLVEEDVLPLTEVMQAAFAELGDTIGEGLSDAARQGQLSIRSMVEDVLRDLSRLAAERLVQGPLEGLAGRAFGGGRAEGGAVDPTATYLVGERGPELFVPPGAGRIATPPSSLSLSISISGDGAGPAADPLRRSSRQIARQVGRLLTQGGRRD